MSNRDCKVIRGIVESRLSGLIEYKSDNKRPVLVPSVYQSYCVSSEYHFIDRQSIIEINKLKSLDNEKIVTNVIVHVYTCQDINIMRNGFAISLDVAPIYCRNTELSPDDGGGENYEYIEVNKVGSCNDINVVAVKISSAHIYISNEVEGVLHEEIDQIGPTLSSVQPYTWLFFYSPTIDCDDLSKLMTGLGFKKNLSNIPTAAQQLALKKFISAIAPRFNKMKWMSFDGDRN